MESFNELKNALAVFMARYGRAITLGAMVGLVFVLGMCSI